MAKHRVAHKKERIPEAKETPSYEADHHAEKFLRKAVKIAESKNAKRKR